jgi:uncharacterized membrane protein YtjA (UPF0391 family)
VRLTFSSSRTPRAGKSQIDVSTNKSFFCKPFDQLELIPTMLHYALVFLIIALIAAFLGFGGLAGTAALIAKVCFVIFLIFAIVSFLKRG